MYGSKDSFTLAALESVVRGHHVIKQVWTPIHGLRLITSVADTKKYQRICAFQRSAPNNQFKIHNMCVCANCVANIVLSSGLLTNQHA